MLSQAWAVALSAQSRAYHLERAAAAQLAQSVRAGTGSHKRAAKAWQALGYARGWWAAQGAVGVYRLG